ncbi:MAG: trypsin-like peptidase domain-containing protein, partial [Ruminococcus sp.]|nr:trypsin-like peptidase domain-containing protein [Candidatus Apopatosoma intestinale]
MEFIRQCPICGSDHVDRHRGGFMVCRSCDNLFFCKNREKNPADFYQKAVRSVFEICLTAEDKERCGTATLISEKGCLITSAHLFRDQSEEHNRLYPLQNVTGIRRNDNGETITAKVLRIGFQTDLALLSAPSLAGISPMPFSYRKVYTGQK